MEPYGYYPVPGPTGIWEHSTRLTKFCVCDDYFGVKYWSKEYADHLCNTLGKTFKYTIDYEVKTYCVLSFDWNYKLGYVNVSMPVYVPKDLQRLQKKHNNNPQYSPHAHVLLVFGPKGTRQYDTTRYTSPVLPTQETKSIQSITGSFYITEEYLILPCYQISIK